MSARSRPARPGGRISPGRPLRRSLTGRDTELVTLDWAADRWRDGQIFIDLHGCSPRSALSAADVLAAALGALGVAQVGTPAGQGERVALFDEIPVITDPSEAAEDLELAVLSVIDHAAGPRYPRRAVRRAAQSRPSSGGMYADMVRAAIPREIWDHLERHTKTETYEYLSDWARENIAKGKAEGEAEGRAEAVLTVLEARGIEVPDELNDKIRKCHDLDRLDAWIRAAATVQSADALLNGDL